MTVMTTTDASDVDAVAREAGLTDEQTRAFRSSAASWAMEGMMPTLEELRVGAEVAAGRLTFAGARRKLGV
jgi:hypothetical protein